MLLEEHGTLRSLWQAGTTLPWWALCLGSVLVCCLTRVLTAFTGTSSNEVSSSKVGRKVAVMPYWLPYLGHVPFLFSLSSSLRAARDQVEAGIFALRLGSSNHYIIHTPSLTKAIFHSPPDTVTKDPILWRVLENMFGARRQSKDIYVPLFKALHKCNDEFLLRRTALAKIVDVTTRGIERNVPQLISRAFSLIDAQPWERAAVPTLVRDSKVTAAEVSFFALVRDFVAITATPSIFGTSLLEQEDLLENIWTFDSGFHFLAMGLPRWLPIRSLSRAYAARDRLLHHLTRYSVAMDQIARGDDPSGEWGDMSDVGELIQTRMKIMREAGISPKFRAPFDLAYLWAMNANANNLVFWIILRICATPGLLERIRTEVAPYASIESSTKGSHFPEPTRLKLDAEGLSRSCPLLKACYLEALRLHSAAVTVKQVRKDIVVTESAADNLSGQAQSYVLEAGSYVEICHELHQSDPRYFEMPEQFMPERFLVAGKDGLKVKDHTLTPYGGGSSICPGRIYAATETVIFAAAILTCWDIGPLGSKGWQIPANQAVTGVSRPAKDIRVMMRSRVE